MLLIVMTFNEVYYYSYVDWQCLFFVIETINMCNLFNVSVFLKILRTVITDYIKLFEKHLTTDGNQQEISDEKH